MKFAFIDAEKASFPISRMCHVLGVSQSGFFAWQERPACRHQQQDMVYLAHIRTAFALSNGTYGSPRMHRDLVDEGHEIGRAVLRKTLRRAQVLEFFSQLPSCVVAIEACGSAQLPCRTAIRPLSAEAVSKLKILGSSENYFRQVALQTKLGRVANVVEIA
ncbi:IS3 family transposase, partial [Paracoccus yeei]|uniref:IS3 family transposase n=1 Tax=Paracoccus yeei TaxID=147645 RepID=UPI001D717F5C|nr:transposase [Paracoccus yeei]